MNENQKIIINSTVLYVITFLLTTIIHEFGHAIVGVINCSQPILYHNYVEHLAINQLSILQKVSISLAGPIFSLIQGILAALLFLKIRKQSLFKLFLLWFSILGFSNFFGYLMTGPIFQEGDIGNVFLLLNIPVILQIIIALIGAIILFYIAYKLTTPFLLFSYKQEWLSEPKLRKEFLFKIIIIPWLIGAIIVTILYLPVIAIVSIIYPFTSGMIFIIPWKNAKRVNNLKASKIIKIGEYSYPAYFSMVILILVFKLILAYGIKL